MSLNFFDCVIFGLGVRCNLPLAALVTLPVALHIDVTIKFGELPAGSYEAVGCEVEEFHVSQHCDQNGVPFVRAARLKSIGATRMSYVDGTVFVINEKASQIWVTTPPNQTVEDTAAYLLGPIMGAVLRMREVTCLHGSAVVIDSRAVAFVGVSGSGKSTTAAAFARLGYAVLSDDILALTDKGSHFFVRPAYPRVRLWPESVAGLFGSADKLPLMTPNWEKRFLELNVPGYRFQDKPLQLAAIYFLAPRETVATIQPVVDAVRSTDALMALISDSYAANYIYKSLRATEFEVLGRLVQSVPLRRVVASPDFSSIDALCHAITKDLQGLLFSNVDNSSRINARHEIG